MTFAEALRQRRTELGYTLLEIADRMGVSEATVQRWECGNIKTLRQGRISQLATILQCSPAFLMGWETISREVKTPRRNTIPLLGTIACGIPILADENIECYIDTPEPVKADFALRCKGDSMINSRIFDGDIVYIRQQETVENGEIAAVLIGTEATLKKVYVYPNRIELRADKKAPPESKNRRG